MFPLSSSAGYKQSRCLRICGFTSADSFGTTVDDPNHANIGLISHVGGHKYAGNAGEVLKMFPLSSSAGYKQSRCLRICVLQHD
jgi:hypothetical protein